MFTGIVECMGEIVSITQEGSNTHYCIAADLLPQLKVDQSIAHNGVCLTITRIDSGHYWVTAVEETLKKTALGSWAVGNRVNLERALPSGGRLDGHFVQGHVDTTGRCVEKKTLDGSWLFTFEYPPAFAALLIEKGSVSINGVSLTVFNVTNSSFTVTIIPYTYEHTSFASLQHDDIVNIEFDMLGKYVNRIMSLRNY
jgi:riboflavin synthase